MEVAGSIATSVRDGWVVWEVADKPVSVRLTVDVVSRMGLAVREGFKALPRRGLETGGLLIGGRKKVGGQLIVEIDDFEAVESEHAAGPSYLLSEPDRQLLESRIAAVSKHASVVGFYRSHTRSGFALTVEDDYLYSTYFRKPSDVFLLIKSNEGAPPTGGFIIREGGKVLAHTPYVQFQFNQIFTFQPLREPVEAPEPPAAIPEEFSERIPERPPKMSQIRPAAPRRNVWIQNWPILAAAAGVAVLALFLSLGSRNGVSSSIADKASPITLNVSSIGSGLRLSWDRRSRADADHAVLWIRDGGQEQRVELDGKQLSEGSVMYWPRTGDVNFRLQWLGSGPVATESVRAIGGPSQPPVSPAGLAAQTTEIPPATLTVSPLLPQAPRHVSIGAVSRRHLREFEPPEALRPDAVIPDAPSLDPLAHLALVRSEDFLHPVVPASAPGHRQDADSSVKVRIEPVPGSRLSQFAKHLPLVGRRYRRPDYTPPAPIREPAIPNPLQRNVAHDVNIDVKVYVNPSGKVDYSEVLSKVAASDRDLAAMAVFSARRCEFVPARAGDDIVPGEVILHYQFGPGALAVGDQATAAR
jgi:hypothetical protein